MADPEAYLREQAGKLVVSRRIHRAPDYLIAARIIDERRRAGDRAGHFLLLGSASLDLIEAASETLAGRVAYLELAPLRRHGGGRWTGRREPPLVAGGFPDSLLARTDADSLDWRRAFVQTTSNGTFRCSRRGCPVETVGRLWTMLGTWSGHRRSTNPGFGGELGRFVAAVGAVCGSAG